MSIAVCVYMQLVMCSHTCPCPHVTYLKKRTSHTCAVGPGVAAFSTGRVVRACPKYQSPGEGGGPATIFVGIRCKVQVKIQVAGGHYEVDQPKAIARVWTGAV